MRMRRQPSGAELAMAIESQGKLIASLNRELTGEGLQLATHPRPLALEAMRAKLRSARAKLIALEAQRELEHAVEQIRADARVASVRWRYRWRMLRTHQVAFAAMTFELSTLRIGLADGSVHDVVVPREATGEDLLIASARRSEASRTEPGLAPRHRLAQHAAPSRCPRARRAPRQRRCR
jgi:hypothetical protein